MRVLRAEASSAEVLAKIWSDFAARAEQESGLPISKRAVSRHYLDSDDKLLSRWLNPGERKNWRIPIYRVPGVCRELRATLEQQDELMVARFAELAQDDTQHEVLVSVLWALSYGDRNRWGLSVDEDRIVSTYREVAKQHPAGLHGSPEETEVLGKIFERVLKSAAPKHMQDLAEPEMRAEDAERLKRQTDKLPATMAETAKARAARQREDARRSAKGLLRQVQEYLKGLRRRRP